MSFADRLRATATAFTATAAHERIAAFQARDNGDLDTAHALNLQARRHRDTARKLRKKVA